MAVDLIVGWTDRTYNLHQNIYFTVETLMTRLGRWNYSIVMLM